MKKNEVEFTSTESSVCLLFSPSRSFSGNVRWGPSLALGRLFEATSDPQFVSVSFRMAGPCCSALLAFYQHKA